MAEPDPNLVEETEILDRAVSRKWNKYTWSGLLIIGIGCILIVIGRMLDEGAYSTEGLLIGFGAIVVLIGLIRVCIGLINPMLPSDLRRARYERRKQNTEELILNTLQDEES
ncbi:hypothetical protein [Dictyobacter arantiisoli]|uniref:Uncharacterized protein n=1 Tax=Dictyobacter arantiisoli TaxID=2014874 RepID=A0A5A5T771_9CHLR|nr:hypothetical protein [Dictyobacter arantiisoli]GCF07247.1 hypothetical protein KDI_08110 [Dictyobacter arantiisoli]